VEGALRLTSRALDERLPSEAVAKGDEAPSSIAEKTPMDPRAAVVLRVKAIVAVVPVGTKADMIAIPGDTVDPAGLA